MKVFRGVLEEAKSVGEVLEAADRGNKARNF